MDDLSWTGEASAEIKSNPDPMGEVERPIQGAQNFDLMGMSDWPPGNMESLKRNFNNTLPTWIVDQPDLSGSFPQTGEGLRANKEVEDCIVTAVKLWEVCHWFWLLFTLHGEVEGFTEVVTTMRIGCHFAVSPFGLFLILAGLACMGLAMTTWVAKGFKRYWQNHTSMKSSAWGRSPDQALLTLKYEQWLNLADHNNTNYSYLSIGQPYSKILNSSFSELIKPSQTTSTLVTTACSTLNGWKDPSVNSMGPLVANYTLRSNWGREYGQTLSNIKSGKRSIKGHHTNNHFHLSLMELGVNTNPNITKLAKKEWSTAALAYPADFSLGVEVAACMANKYRTTEYCSELDKYWMLNTRVWPLKSGNWTNFKNVNMTKKFR